jgi:hypothetical protein
VVELDGSASRDPDAGPQPLTYFWEQLSGPSVLIASSTAPVASITPMIAGTYLFRLTVDDGEDQATDTVAVLVGAGAADVASAVTGSDTSALTSTSGEWDTNNQRRSWWNSYRQRWDAVLPVSGPPATGTSHWWLTAGVDTGSPRMLAEFDAATGVRPDAYWDEATRKLFVLGTRSSKTYVTTYDYDPVADTYTPDIWRRQVAGADSSSNRAVIHRTPNGTLWTAVMADKAPQGLWVNRSTDGGATWGTPALLASTSAGGQTNLVHFTRQGRTYLAIAGAEDGKAVGSRYRFLYLDQDATDWREPSAWTDESMLMYAPEADEHSDDEISMIVDDQQNIYITAETEPGPSGSRDAPQLVLLKRHASGSWEQVAIARFDPRLKARKRPTVAIDGPSRNVVVSSVDQSRTAIATVVAPLDDVSALSGQLPREVVAADGQGFRNAITPRSPTTAESGMLLLVDNLTERTIWMRNLR